MPLEPTFTAIGHANSSSRAATISRNRDMTTVTSSCHEGSCTNARTLPTKDYNRWIRRSHLRGLVNPPRTSSRQGSNQSRPRGRPTLATTAPSNKEVPSLARGLGTVRTPPRQALGGHAASRTTTTRFTIAFDTSVSYANCDRSFSTQAHPHTCANSPIVVEA